ncbi:MAG: hypothetical protein HC905_05435 [Bacteroidales bacterium]|nr:hypothetical protein [Bacteroidales bacterium]
MKNIKYNRLFAFLITLFLGVGCSSNYLDIEPKGVISMNSFYKTDDDAKGAIYAVYDILQGMNADSWTSMYMLKTLQADEIYCGGARRGDYPPYEELNEFRYGSSNAVITKLFEQSYWGIYRANMVIENVAPDSPAKKVIIAEAKALRALLYFDLVDLWGKVPLVLITAKTPTEYNQKRAETAEVWSQIEKDLLEAIPDLPLKSEQKGGDVVRFSKGAAQSTLGKAYLFQKKYAEASNMFKKVIDSNEYGLEPDYSRILRKDTEFKVESVFEISYSADKIMIGDIYMDSETK